MTITAVLLGLAAASLGTFGAKREFGFYVLLSVFVLLLVTETALIAAGYTVI